MVHCAQANPGITYPPKEKLLAAHRMGCQAVLIPRDNARNLEELPEEVRTQLRIHLVADMDEVIRLGLVRPGVVRGQAR